MVEATAPPTDQEMRGLLADVTSVMNDLLSRASACEVAVQALPQIQAHVQEQETRLAAISSAIPEA